jgi:nitroreductase
MSTTTEARPAAGPEQVLAETLDTLVAMAARAPSVHNTQPWRFHLAGPVLEFHADPDRRLDHVDPDSRELLISCGAALFGLRLAVRQLGYRPIVELVPVRLRRPGLIARIRLGPPTPLRPGERMLLTGLRRRHTHRGPFAPEPLPAGLLAALQREAEAEAAALVVVRDPPRHGQLVALVAAAERRQRHHPVLDRELRAWTRPPGSLARDGVPARAFSARPATHLPGALAPRDFDLGRGWGTPPDAGEAPAATAVLTTGADTPADWLRAGQALHRVLLRAASDWVFASLHTQPLEIAPLRAAVRAQLQLPGAPQMLLQLGRARVTVLTPRRPAGDLIR